VAAFETRRKGTLQNIAVIRLVQGGLAWYPPGASEEPQWLDNDIAREKLRAVLAQRKVLPVFGAPGGDVRLQRLQITAQEKKHLARSLPFMLEEQVAADIDDLHFACQPLDNLELATAVCSLEKMREWQTRLADYAGINQWVPEPLLLPWQAGEWCLVLEGEGAIVRTGSCEGFSIEREMVPALLCAVLEDAGEPQAVILYGQDQALDSALVPDSLAGRVQWRQGNLYTALMLGEQPQPPLNLLQRDFAPRLPLQRWWHQWRAAAMLFGAAFVLQLVATYADYRNLQAQNLALRSAVQDSYRQAYPRGAVVDAEKQLRRQLDALRGSAQSSGFVSLLARVGEVIAGSGGTSIASINYNDKAGEMRMNIVAADYEAVEQVREAINKAGLQAVMESSSAQGDKVRARLRVGQRS
jgi:type II secretion system protein L